MLELTLNFWQILVIVASMIIIYFYVKKTITILLKIIFSNKKVMAWNLKRQLAQKKLVKKTELQQLNENINILEQFVEWVGKQVPNKQHKQFWRDFANSKETRGYWVKTLRDIISMQIKELDKNDNIKK